MEEVLQKPVITKTQPTKKSSSKSSKPRRKVLVALRKPLKTKKAVELLLKGSLKRKVCRYCLNIAYPLSDLDQCLSIGGRGALYNVAIRDMVASFHPFKVVEDPNFPNKICPKCVKQALQAYLFAQQCEQAQRALRNCFDDMYSKMQKLDSLEPTKKRGRQKNHPNYNVLYTEHAKVIDYAEPIRNLINCGSVSLTNESKMSELECKKCWQVLPNVESLVNHEKMHPKTMWYHCRLCGQSFTKLFHIRRHLKTKHGNKAQEIPSNPSFMCKQCSFTSEDYNTHLQHVEKHKFKNVIEHLVERKMDELCSVCLDKGALQDLEKTIRLHGAYPELTGNRSLYNILGSTIPEKEKHKYKELLVPSYANVLTITKKAKNNTFDNHDQAEKLKLNRFTISHPFIVAKECVGDKDMYLFIFSEPEMLSLDKFLIVEENIDKVDECYKKKENQDVDNVKRSISCGSEKEKLDFLKKNIQSMEECEVNNSIEKIVVITLKNREVLEMDNESNTCKFCWVFNKTDQCDVCEKRFLVNNNDTEIAKFLDNEAETHIIDSDIELVAANEHSRTVYSEDNPLKCSLCWVFKTIGKCSYCHTLFKNTFTKPEPVLETVNIAKDDDKIGNNKARKRKPDKPTEKATASKVARWECSICLTANDDNRDACICCDMKTSKDDSVKINFGSNTTYLKGIQETSKKLNLSCTNTAIDTELNKASNNLADNCNENSMELETDNNAIFEKYTPFILDGTVTHTQNECSKMQCSDDFETTTEKLDGNAMDFEDTDNVNKHFSPINVYPYPSHMLSPTNSVSDLIQNSVSNFSPIGTILPSLNSQPKTFQFNIGTSLQDVKSARKKRPLRRIATTINK